MFNTTNEETLAVTHGRFKELIIGTDNSVAINYEEGYMNGDTFVPLGVNHITAKDTDAYTDSEGNTVPAETGYTDFLAQVMAAGATKEAVEAFIVEVLNG